jgi:hypothetical protein
MNVDVSVSPRVGVDVSVPSVIAPDAPSHPGMLRPFPQSIFPASARPGTLVSVGGFQFASNIFDHVLPVQWVKIGTDLYTSSNGGLVIVDDSRLTFTTRAGGILGMALDVVVGAGSLYEASHSGVLPTAFTNLAPL